jgi:hypothetical protein
LLLVQFCKRSQVVHGYARGGTRAGGTFANRELT